MVQFKIQVGIYRLEKVESNKLEPNPRYPVWKI